MFSLRSRSSRRMVASLAQEAMPSTTQFVEPAAVSSADKTIPASKMVVQSFSSSVPSVSAKLHYQQYTEGQTKRIGRFIGEHPEGSDTNTHSDEHAEVGVSVYNARGMVKDIDADSFTLIPNPTAIKDWQNVDEMKNIYYPEMQTAVKKALPSCSRVFVFDHTLRQSSVTQLNAFQGAAQAAGSVVRVHCDYTAESAPIRLLQLAKAGEICGLSVKDAEGIILGKKRFAFINVWRSTDANAPVMQKPLAVCDYKSAYADRHNWLLYELMFPNRVGENYSLTTKNAASHKWWYYDQLIQDECMVFKVYDRHKDKAPFCFHTAFDPLNADGSCAVPEGAPPRQSVETRCIAVWDNEIITSEYETSMPVYNIQPAPTFYDMVHSNNAASIRLWLDMKKIPEALVNRVMLTYADLADPNYAHKNPNKKAPAATIYHEITKNPSNIDNWNGRYNRKYEAKPLFEGYVIRLYLEAKFQHVNPEINFTPRCLEEKGVMDLLVRVHDIYISSPNCCQEGFSHTQGSMYLAPCETKWCAKQRVMNIDDREKKLKELWEKMTWLEERIEENNILFGQGPYLLGNKMTHADFVWYPTVCFMDYLLPRNFNWNVIGHFPNLTKWHQYCTENHPEFKGVKDSVFGFFGSKDEEGMFEELRKLIKETGGERKWVYP